MIGLTEVLVIGGIVVLVFGATRIPKLAKSIGEGIKELKKAAREPQGMDDEQSEEQKEEDQDA